VFGDFDVMGTILFPDKAHPVLIVDPDTVLPRAAALQGFQPNGRDQRIRQDARVVERKQAPPCRQFDIRELFDGLPVEQALGLLAGERPDYILRVSEFYIVR